MESRLTCGTTVDTIHPAFHAMDFDLRQHPGFDHQFYSLASHDSYKPRIGHLYGEGRGLPVDCHLRPASAQDVRGLIAAGYHQPGQTLIPVTHHFTDIHPTFVNPRQYEAIMRRRMKKMRQQRALGLNQIKVKRKVKYETRSRHARSRIRGKDGKFLSAAENNETRTASTLLKVQEKESRVEKTPCCAENHDEVRLPQPNQEERESSVKLEMEAIESYSMNSDEMLEDLRASHGQIGGRDLGHTSVFERGHSLRHHDSIFESRR
jgi:hypothetical protein